MFPLKFPNRQTWHWEAVREGFNQKSLKPGFERLPLPFLDESSLLPSQVFWFTHSLTDVHFMFFFSSIFNQKNLANRIFILFYFLFCYWSSTISEIFAFSIKQIVQIYIVYCILSNCFIFTKPPPTITYTSFQLIGIGLVSS